jgi:hypothetical protein
MLFSEASSEILDGMEDLGLLPHGAHLYRKPNGAGGHAYYSDECGAMSFVWDTCLAHRSTLLAALLIEEHREYLEQISKKEKTISGYVDSKKAEDIRGSLLNHIPKDKVE